jgi:hypothetical protein
MNSIDLRHRKAITESSAKSKTSDSLMLTIKIYNKRLSTHLCGTDFYA